MSKKDLRQLDYQKIGKLDAELWQAYYNHKFFKLFWLLLRLTKEQLGQRWFVTIRLAYYSAWVAADYRINRRNLNRERVVSTITKYFKLMSKHLTEPFDYNKAAELELRWWDIHRGLYENNEELEKALADSMAVIYHVHPSTLKDYAHYRAEAMMLPRHKGDKENKTDWVKVQRLTIKSWQELAIAANKA